MQFQEILLNATTPTSLISAEFSNFNNNSSHSISSSGSNNNTSLFNDDINYEDTIKILATATLTMPPPTDEATAGAKFKNFDCDYYLAINVSSPAAAGTCRCHRHSMLHFCSTLYLNMKHK